VQPVRVASPDEPVASAPSAAPAAWDFPRRSLFGVWVHPLRMDEVLDAAHTAITERRPLTLGMVNVAKIVKLQHDAPLRDSILWSDLVLADGLPIVWSGTLLRQPLPERVPGIDIFYRLLERAGRHGYRVFFLGARQEVLDEVVRRATAEHPGLVVAGARDGYFGTDEFEAVADEVAAAEPDVLFIAMTTPKKENLLRVIGQRGQLPVAHGVGGSFDVYAGKVKRAPRWMQRVGLEWAYRVLQEPRRLFMRYAVTNAKFVWLLLRNLVRPALAPDLPGRRGGASRAARPHSRAPRPRPRRRLRRNSGSSTAWSASAAATTGTTTTGTTTCR